VKGPASATPGVRRERVMPQRPRLVVPLVLLIALAAPPALAHDPSAWGGLFRSRDGGATWVLASPGRYPTAAVAVAISPIDPNHLLLGTDSGLLRSRNGGRDWDIEAPKVLTGAGLAAVFATDGHRALVSMSTGVFRSDGNSDWHPTPLPSGAVPARAIVRGSDAGRAFLAGWTGLLRTDDWGASWSNVADGLPDAPATALVVAPGSPERVYVVVDARIWMRTDGAGSWVSRDVGLSGLRIEALGLDSGDPPRLWTAGADRVFRSDDGGASWQPVGKPLPEPNTTVHAILATGRMIVLTTHRGLYRAAGDEEPWEPVVENLPAHLEAGPLLRDPADPTTLYAGFAVVPYTVLWRRAAEGAATLRHIDLTSLLGGVAFLMLLALAAGAILRRLGRYYRAPLTNASAAGTAHPDHGIKQKSRRARQP
jgi:hypothetical protein